MSNWSLPGQTIEWFCSIFSSCCVPSATSLYNKGKIRPISFFVAHYFAACTRQLFDFSALDIKFVNHFSCYRYIFVKFWLVAFNTITGSIVVWTSRANMLLILFLPHSKCPCSWSNIHSWLDFKSIVKAESKFVILWKTYQWATYRPHIVISPPQTGPWIILFLKLSANSLVVSVPEYKNTLVYIYIKKKNSGCRKRFNILQHPSSKI